MRKSNTSLIDLIGTTVDILETTRAELGIESETGLIVGTDGMVLMVKVEGNFPRPYKFYPNEVRVTSRGFV